MRINQLFAIRLIWIQDAYRIMEIADDNYRLVDLKGDCFKPGIHNLSFTDKELARQELEFEALVEEEGVFGYELQNWNPAIGKGWESTDSCWGFVGQYSKSDEKLKHYIVDEMKNIIADCIALQLKVTP